MLNFKFVVIIVNKVSINESSWFTVKNLRDFVLAVTYEIVACLAQ